MSAIIREQDGVTIIDTGDDNALDKIIEKLQKLIDEKKKTRR
jgi:hypothetical protein